MPTGDGSYAVSAHARDQNSNVNAIIAGGLPGNNQVIFTVDATPPLLTIAGPVVDTVVTAPPLPAGWIHGTASDSSGPVTVSFRLKRPGTDFVGDVFWNEELWQEEGGSFGADVELDGTFPGAGGATSWSFTGVNPTLGWEAQHCLTNGEYEIVAVAKDLAGNETTRIRPFTVDYYPQYIPPAFESMPLLPVQVPVFLPDALGVPSVRPADARVDEFDPRVTQTSKIAISNGGLLYAASHVLPVFPEPGTAGIVLQRLGVAPWRVELTGYSSIAALDTDTAGNLYALLKDATTGVASLLKYSASGAYQWTRQIPDVVPHPAFIGGPTLQRMAWLPDGSLGLLFTFSENNGFGSYSTDTVMTVVEADGDVRYARSFGVTDASDPENPAHFESTPVDFAGDTAGNVFVASLETGRFTGYGQPQAPQVRRIIRKLSPGGAVLATHATDTCDFPEVWDKLATDPAGSLYVAGRFIGGVRSQDDPGRQEVIKFDPDLAWQWRAFGPPRNPDAGDTVTHVDAGADGLMCIDNSGMASFFTAGGALQWARQIIPGGSNTQLFTFTGGSAVGMVYTGSVEVVEHLVKISRAGDTQFDLALATGFDHTADLRADSSHIYLLRQSFGAPAGHVMRFDNLPDATLPVTLDPLQPADQILIAGDALELSVINQGTLATGHQWRKYEGEVPAGISIAEKFTIGSVVVGDTGQFDCVVTNPIGSATSRRATVTVLAPAALDVALETPGRVWTSGGDAPFVGFAAAPPNGPAHDGVDAAMNRPLQSNQTSFIETTVTGPGAVTFWWKSSAEAFVDGFSFGIDDAPLSYITGEQDWTPVTQEFGPGPHTLRWTYSKVSNSTAQADRVWLDQITITGDTSVPLAEALDTSGLTWTTSAGGLAWTGSTALSHDGVDAAGSGTTGNDQQSYVETTVTGPGTLTFWWKVSCEETFDSLAFSIAGAPSGSISGEVDWAQATRTIPAGTHTLRWSYNKDGFGAGGLDRAWLDEVAFTPSGGGQPEIVVEQQPATQDLADNAATIDFGTALPGNNTVRTFTIRNTGTAQLSGLLVTRNGTHDSEFTPGSPGQNLLNPGEETTFTVTFTPGASGARSAAIHIQSNDADENTFDIQLTGSGGVSLTSWRQEHFLTTTNTGDAADDADPDRDGVLNLLEFATGGSPMSSSRDTTNVAPPSGGLVHFHYTRNKLAMAELTYQVEWNDSLVGPWSSVGVVETITGDNGVMQQVRADFPAGALGKRFARLRVTRP